MALQSDEQYKVFCIGMFQTGTHTISNAIQNSVSATKIYGDGWNLDIVPESNSPVYFDLKQHTSSFWHGFAIKNKKQIMEIIDKHQVFCDVPFLFIYQYIYEWYPKSIFILTKQNARNVVANDILCWIQHNINCAKFKSSNDRKNAFMKRYITHNTSVEHFFSDKPNKLFVVNWENKTCLNEINISLKNINCEFQINNDCKQIQISPKFVILFKISTMSQLKLQEIELKSDTEFEVKCDNNISDRKNCNENIFYKITPINPVGAIVTNINLSTTELSKHLIKCIRSDIHKHQLLIFKHQSPENNYVIPPMKRLEIAHKFGSIISFHYNHPNAPHRDIFRVSNDSQKGCLNVGRTGWHIDGSFWVKPYNYSMMHIICVPKSGFGQTAFISSSAAIDNVLNKCKELNGLKILFNKLYMVGTSGHYAIHPIIYKHPITQKNTMLIHLGMTATFIEVNDKYAHLNIDKVLQLHNQLNDDNNEILKVYNQTETQNMLKEIELFIEKCKENNLMYKHEYEKGDLLMSDNLAMLHEAVPSTQFGTKQIGLRIMDRITVGADYIPHYCQLH
eukprot:168193_1